MADLDAMSNRIRGRIRPRSLLWDEPLGDPFGKEFSALEDDPVSIESDEYDSESSTSPPLFEEISKNRALSNHSVTWVGQSVVYVCFFFCGIGMTILWNSLLGLVPYFIELHGQKIQGTLITAYNLPALPILFVQTKFDYKLDKRLGRRRTFYARALISLFLLMVSAALFSFPVASKNQYFLVGLAVMVGVGQGMAFGSFFQFVALFPAAATPFLLMGNGMSSIVLLGISVVTDLVGKHATNPSSNQLIEYFASIGGVLLLSLIFFIVLMNSSVFRSILEDLELKPGPEGYYGAPTDLQQGRLSLLAFNQEGQSEKGALLLGSSTSSNSSEIFHPHTDISLLQLASLLKLPMLSMYFNMFSTVIVLTFFAYVPSSGRFASLVQILNYANLLADFVGRQLVLIKWLRNMFSNTSTFVITILRALAMGLFFVYIGLDAFRNDFLAIGFVIFYSLIGGYTNTLIYIFGTQLVPMSVSSRASSVLNLVLQIAVFSALPWQFFVGPSLPASK